MSTLRAPVIIPSSEEEVQQLQSLKSQFLSKSRTDFLYFLDIAPTRLPKKKEGGLELQYSALQDVAGFVFLPKAPTTTTTATGTQADDVAHITSWIEEINTHFPTKPVCVSASDSRLSMILLVASLHGQPVHVYNVHHGHELLLVSKMKSKGLQVSTQVDTNVLCVENPELLNFIGLIDVIGGRNALSQLVTASYRKQIELQQIIERVHGNPRRIFSVVEQPNTALDVEIDDVSRGSVGFATVSCNLQRVQLRGETLFLDGKEFSVSADKFKVSNAYLPPTTAVSPPTLRSVSSSGESHIEVLPASQLPTSPLSRSLANITPTSASATQSPSHVVHHGPKQIRTQTPKSGSVVTVPTVAVAGSKQRPSRSLRGTDVISVAEFDRDLLHTIFTVAQEMMALVRRVGTVDILKDCVMANVFYEPSTRTSMSFAAAMERLGGSVVYSNSETSSARKGESLGDTIRTVDQYADIIVLRHPESGSAALAAKHAKKPVINAGDGTGEHPTQALLDVFTIRNEMGTVNKLTVTLVGDLKNGRTVHSLVKLLSLYSGLTLNYVCPKELKLPSELFNHLASLGLSSKISKSSQSFFVAFSNVLRHRTTRIFHGRGIPRVHSVYRCVVLHKNPKREVP